jgi:octaprenyl-diphosphate synthase
VLQLLNCGDPEVDEARYLRVIELKTARLFEAACRVGALVAGAPAAVVAACGRYGHHLGMAFQLVDDVLDFVADEAESGKRVGTDLAEGKPTLPLIHARDHGEPAAAAHIRAAIAQGGSEACSPPLKPPERCPILSRSLTVSAATPRRRSRDCPNPPSSRRCWP